MIDFSNIFIINIVQSFFVGDIVHVSNRLKTFTAKVMSDPIGEEGKIRHTPEFFYNSPDFLFDIEEKYQAYVPIDRKYVLVEYENKRRAFVPWCCTIKAESRYTVANLHQALRVGMDILQLNKFCNKEEEFVGKDHKVMREIVTDLAHLFAEEDPESNLVPFMLTAVNDVYTLTIVYYFIHEKPDVISLYGY